MNYIVFEHLSGSKANEVEEFSLGQYSELLVGRDPTSNVRFAPDETLVGRQHLKLGPDPNDPSRFLITDLNSRNGTFLNGHRVIGTTVLKPGDTVQCGPRGPEFRFNVRPPTESLVGDPPPTQPGEVHPGPVADPTAAGFPLAHLAAGAPGPTPPPKDIRPPANVPPATAQNQAPPEASAAEPHVQVYAAKPARSSSLGLIAAAGIVTMVMIAAGFIAYRTFTSTEDTRGSSSTPQPSPAASDASTATAGSSPAADDAEKDPERAAWQLDVAPYLTLGAGGPGKGASEFDKPDGLAFSPNGLLFATDAGNRRVQVWDVKTGAHLGEFGHGILGSSIANIAVAPNETVLVTDQTQNVAYAFVPPQPGELDDKGQPLGPYDYRFKGTRLAEQKFKKLSGIAIDKGGRIYVVDALANSVTRFLPGCKFDPSFKFEQKRPDGDTFLHGAEGVVVDETSGNLFVTSEKDAVIVVFDAETGAYRQKLVGASLDAASKPAGKHVFFGAVEGLAVAGRHLMAVDEQAGHIQLFDLDQTDTFNNDLTGFGAPQPNRPSGYRGYLGRSPLVNFEDQTNVALQNQVRTGAVLPGQANPPGHFCSPDAIATHHDSVTGETYIAIADQCNYRLAIYRWSDIAKVLGQPIIIAAASTTPTPAPVASPTAVAEASPTPSAPAPSTARKTRSSAIRRRPRTVLIIVPTKKQKEAQEKAAKEAKKKKKQKP